MQRNPQSNKPTLRKVSIFLRVSVVILVMGLTPHFGSIAVAADAKPNIVFILADDMGYADVGFNGCQDIKTPNVDKLAERGTILTSHYAQPVCSPTRAALLTGRYPLRTGVYSTINVQRPALFQLNERLLSEGLRDAGYVTAICGKWHLGQSKPEFMPTRRGFDHQYGFMSGSLDPFTKVAAGTTDTRDWYRNDQPCADEGYDTDLLAQEACRIIENKPADKPLFLYVPFHSVHTPWKSTSEDQEPYANLPGRRKDLAGITAGLDRAVGQIMAELDAKGLTENTLVIFSSDNGGTSWNGSAYNTPLRGGKTDIYEGGMRVCAFATWPGRIPGGVKNDEPIHIIDWYPTLLRLAGGSLEQPLPIDGKDIWPMLTQGAKSPHDEVLLLGSTRQRAIRMGDWKLLLNPSERPMDGKSARPHSDPVELYNLSKDIGEATNLASSHPDRVQAMLARLNELTANPDHIHDLKKSTTP